MGKTAHDIVRGLGGLHAAVAKAIAREPTGITPGFDPTTGIAWNEDGTARYRSGAAGTRLVGLLTRGASSAVNIAQGGTTRLQFGTGYGAATTGATSYITVPVAAYYRIDVSIGMRGVSGTYGLNDFFDIFIHRQDTNAQLNSGGTFAYTNIDAGTYGSSVFVPINGSMFLNLPAGLGIYLKAENQCSVSGNATAPQGSQDFFAVSYA